jgi:hypothetical protein
MQSAYQLGRRRGTRWILFFGLLALFLGQLQDRAMAAETIFLHDGRTIQADKIEIIGDTLRIEKPTETIEIPRSEVLSIHPSAPSKVSPGPADVYPDTTRQMNDKVRREIESKPRAGGVQ